MKVFILLCLVFSVVFAETRLIRQNAVNKTVVLKLKSGWNLVSLPGYQSYFASTFFNEININRILSYNKYINQWMSYYSDDKSRFKALVLHPGVGYWMKANYDFNIAISSNYKTSVAHLTDDRLAKEILDEQNKGSIVVDGHKWMKAVFRHITFNDAKKECARNNARLPNIGELFQFYKRTSVSSNQFYGEHVFYWTSDTFAKSNKRWIIDFGTGSKALEHIDTYNSVRCLLY